jgi:hypothetical protein
VDEFERVATVLGSILASSDTVESEGRQMKQCLILYIEEKKSKKSPSVKLHNTYGCRESDLRKNRELAQLKKETRRNESRIKSLETERRIKETVLKRKQEEVANLR